MLKLGSQTASVTNHLLSRGVIGAPSPEVGMGVTFLYLTDRSAGTIAFIIFNKRHKIARIGCREDKATRIDANGMSESQDYRFEENPLASIKWYAKNRKGFWIHMVENERGNFVQSRGPGLRIGERDHYHDFSF